MTLGAEDRAALDDLGPVLCRLGHRSINLTWSGPKGDRGGYYFVDGRDADDRFFSGHGDTPSEALLAATRDRHTVAQTLVHA